MTAVIAASLGQASSHRLSRSVALAEPTAEAAVGDAAVVIVRMSALGSAAGPLFCHLVITGKDARTTRANPRGLRHPGITPSHNLRRVSAAPLPPRRRVMGLWGRPRA
jgi:hypothetical protein